jgi:hypothetical protein
MTTAGQQLQAVHESWALCIARVQLQVLLKVQQRRNCEIGKRAT